jgi:hypothetical protein
MAAESEATCGIAPSGPNTGPCGLRNDFDSRKTSNHIFRIINIVLAAFCELPSGINLPLRNFENRGRARFGYFLEIICFTEFLRFHCRNQVPGRYPKSSAATVPVADETASGENANVPDTAAQGEDLTSQLVPEHVSHLRQSSGR